MMLTENEMRKKACPLKFLAHALALMEGKRGSGSRCDGSECAAWRWGEPEAKPVVVPGADGWPVVKRVPRLEERRGYCGIGGWLPTPVEIET